MRNLTHAVLAASATTALGAAAQFAGAATQNPVPAPPVVLAAADDNGDASAEAIAILNATIDPEGWEAIVGDGRED